MKEVEESLVVEEKKRIQQENLKRYFYTLVTNAKKTLGAKHIGYYVETISLFDSVMKMQKSVEDWPSYIMEELTKNPSKWIDKKKLSKIKELYNIA